MKTRIRVLLGLIALLATLAIPTISAQASSTQTIAPVQTSVISHHCGTRQISGQGHNLAFCKGERVDADQIHMTISGVTWNYFHCHFDHAPVAGYLTTGIDNPNRVEIHTHVCSSADRTTGTPIYTGVGKLRAFGTKHYVVGYMIQAGGFSYPGCVSRSLTWSGTVLSGAINPAPGDMAGHPDCTKVRAIRGYRISTKDLSDDMATFAPDYGVLGAYIVLYNPNGTVYKKYQNCYIDQSTAQGYARGEVHGGLVSYWPDDLNAHPLPGCGSSGTDVTNS